GGAAAAALGQRLAEERALQTLGTNPTTTPSQTTHTSTGVLCLRGEFVTPGYFDLAAGKIVPLDNILTLEDGLEYFNTNDRVEIKCDNVYESNSTEKDKVP
ncbi:unnamed protein product, partial [Amoebophrya sp. A120]